MCNSKREVLPQAAVAQPVGSRLALMATSLFSSLRALAHLRRPSPPAARQSPSTATTCAATHPTPLDATPTCARGNPKCAPQFPPAQNGKLGKPDHFRCRPVLDTRYSVPASCYPFTPSPLHPFTPSPLHPFTPSPLTPSPLPLHTLHTLHTLLTFTPFSPSHPSHLHPFSPYPLHTLLTFSPSHPSHLLTLSPPPSPRQRPTTPIDMPVFPCKLDGEKSPFWTAVTHRRFPPVPRSVLPVLKQSPPRLAEATAKWSNRVARGSAAPPWVGGLDKHVNPKGSHRHPHGVPHGAGPPDGFPRT